MNPYLVPRLPVAPAILSLGCMNFGKRTRKADALAIVDRALDAGIGLLDTANVYNDGASEVIVGEALRGRRDAALVATKVGAGRVGGRPEGLGRARVLAACDESLARLGIERIDLYYLHVPDHGTPIEDTLDAIGELLRAGKIAHWGVSNYASWQILELRQLATAAGIPVPAVSQVLYNPLIRQLDVEYFKFTRRFPMHTTVYNPLAGGLLTGQHADGVDSAVNARFDGNAMYRRRYWRSAMFAAVAELAAVAAAEGLTLVELAYAFALGRPGVDSVLVGPGSLAHLEVALTARDKRLSPEALARLDAVHQELVGTDASYAR
jgi:aryl-alcohol dehydrogenase-like predicted oxidoreductase